MVEEAEPAVSLFHALPDMHGNRVDVRLRLANDQCFTDLGTMEGLCVPPSEFAPLIERAD